MSERSFLGLSVDRRESGEGVGDVTVGLQPLAVLVQGGELRREHGAGGRNGGASYGLSR